MDTGRRTSILRVKECLTSTPYGCFVRTKYVLPDALKEDFAPEPFERKLRLVMNEGFALNQSQGSPLI